MQDDNPLKDVLSLISQEVKTASDREEKIRIAENFQKREEQAIIDMISLISKKLNSSVVKENISDAYIEDLARLGGKQLSSEEIEATNQSNEYDFEAYRERLNQYIQQERELEIEEGASDDGDSGPEYPEALGVITTVCIGNNVNAGPAGTLDGVYTSQRYYINGKRWFILTSPETEGDEPDGETTIKFHTGAWRIENSVSGLLYFSNSQTVTPDLATGWTIAPAQDGTWSAATALNVYDCSSELVTQETLEFNFSVASLTAQDQFIGSPVQEGAPFEFVTWSVTTAPENSNMDIAVQFDFSGSASAGDITIDPRGLGSYISSTQYNLTLNAVDGGAGSSEFRVIRDPLDLNTDGNATFFIRFLSGSDTTGQKAVSGGALSAVEVTITD